MKAEELYQKLENDFISSECRDDWSRMDFNEFISANFQKRYMGLLADNTATIKKVYTAVFPSDKVLKQVLAKGEQNILVFTHHPMDWITRNMGTPFQDINKEFLSQLKEKRISIYTLHVPLDKNGEYSTSVNYAKAIGVSYDEDFAEYFGVMAGVIGKSSAATLSELAKQVAGAVGHKVKILPYGQEDIARQKIAVVGGGGNDLDIMKELIEKNIKTFVTGIVKAINDYPPAVAFDKLAKDHKINLIGATHYSSEKFACQKMCDYFTKMSLTAEYVEDEPDFGDL